MASIMQRTPRDGDRATGTRLGVAPPSTGRRRRTPELVVGVLLVAGGALASLVLATSGRERTPVVALAGDVSRGEVIAEDDLTTVHVGSDASIAHTAEDEAATLVGRVAVSDLAAGTVLTPELVAAPAELVGPGEGTVGLSLEAGQVPSLRLAPGDRVSVVAGADAASGRESGTVARAGVVVAVEEITADGQLGAQRRWWVALRAPEDEAAAVAQVVAGGGRVQLVLVGS
jgi:hypothetical protein